MDDRQPTQREIEILNVLWDRGEATVRDVYETLRRRLPIVQNTVQAFLRLMEQKGLVEHREEGRSFIYRPLVERQSTHRDILARLLHPVYDNSVDRLVPCALSAKPPSESELQRLEAMIDDLRSGREKPRAMPRGRK